jgi:hypothetical protein
LIQDGIVTTAALNARDDLIAAAMSMERLGKLTSGMWRALSRELVTAVERLDQQVDDRLEDVHRRAKALDVAADAVLAAGVAAGHLAEHRETLDAVLPTLEEKVIQLAAPDVLLGFSIDDEVLFGDEELAEDELDSADDDVDAEDEAADRLPALAIDVWVFLWPVPLSPARVRIVPDLDVAGPAKRDVSSVSFEAEADEALVDALSVTQRLSREDILPALSALGLACWSAHQADEDGEDDDDDDDDDDTDDEDASDDRE